MSKLELNPHKSVHNPDFVRRDIIAAEIEKVIDALKAFFNSTRPAYTEWERAVNEFQERVPELARSLIEIIERERRSNRRDDVDFVNQETARPFSRGELEKLCARDCCPP